MSDKVKVSPTPIQRNSADVAIELLEMHLRKEAVDANEIEVLYAKYYALARALEATKAYDLKVLVTNEIRAKLWKS
ncbi:hypothetical protein ACP2W0_08390 [Pseudobacillus badius]|uniref:hypothetical protein n=1 Tax=Bacillus badius TaxID=1455 RepID=UPI003CF5101B